MKNRFVLIDFRDIEIKILTIRSWEREEAQSEREEKKTIEIGMQLIFQVQLAYDPYRMHCVMNARQSAPNIPVH